MRNLMFALALCVPLPTYAQNPVWFTVIAATKQAPTLSVSLPAGTIYRFVSANGLATAPVTLAAAKTISDWDDGLSGRTLTPIRECGVVTGSRIGTSSIPATEPALRSSAFYFLG
jgi:hypothetical protein